MCEYIKRACFWLSPLYADAVPVWFGLVMGD